jgi:predicted transcriptional regulator of viral defense system
MTPSALLAGLPRLFSYTDARKQGLSDRDLRMLQDRGEIEKIGRGLFSASDLHADPDLIEIAFRAPLATLCLTSALARHGLTDDIPATIDIALPRGMRTPATSVPASWHKFSPDTFDLGREMLEIGGGYQIGLYSAERSICDAFRLSHQEGSELAIEALKRWLRQPRTQPSDLLAMAAKLGPKAAGPLRATLQILL